MQFCSVGRVIDALIAIPAADALGSGYYLPTETRSAPIISDGPWLQDALPNELVVIGISPTEASTGQANAGRQQNNVMGLPLNADEDYEVFGWIRVFSGDSNAQKAVRDRCLQLFSVYEYALRSDPTLGMPPLRATINTTDFDQDPVNVDGAAFWIAFTVHIQNRLNSV